MNLIKCLFLITIFFINSFVYAQQVEEIRQVFERSIELNENYVNSKKISDREKIEVFTENYLHSSFQDFKNQMFLNLDKELFLLFIKLLSKTTNSTDEFPIKILGEIYIRYPDKALNFINLSIKKEKLLKLLEYGVEINCYALKEKIRDSKK